MDKIKYKAILLPQVIRNVIILIALIALIIFSFIWNVDGLFFTVLKNLLFIFVALTFIEFEKIEVYNEKIVHLKSHMLGIFSKRSVVEYNSVKSISIGINSAKVDNSKNNFFDDLKELKNPYSFLSKGQLYSIVLTWPNLTRTEIPTKIKKDQLDIVIQNMNEKSDYKTLIKPNNKN